MKPERWKQVDALFDAALELEPDKRAAFLDQACAGDEALRKEVDTLLDSDRQAHSFIESPAIHEAAELLSDRPAVLSPGESIGPYKIVSLIGAGGMGEVYRAGDPRLGRDVAVKILPAHYSQDRDRMRRFEQEARAAGALNHPNILAIYDVGFRNGSPYLVSEMLQGELLRQKLKGEQLSTRKVVQYSLQLAKGLSAAHEKGIVHRDLKPENIFITKEGLVKILDFGLAKLTQPEVSANAAPAEHQTETGVVLGTVVYMSPEQVRGLKVSHRSDIFAFGAVLYEMLSGKRPFRGDSQIEVMHEILKADPPELTQSNPAVPPALERIVRRCLEKDPDHRFQSTSDLAFALESLSSDSGPPAIALPPARKRVHPAWILTALFFLATLVLAMIVYRSIGIATQQDSPDVRRLSIVLPEHSIINSFAVSPDGRRVAYAINEPIGPSTLWLRSLDSTQSEQIPGSEEAAFPFWSPDSRSIGFFTWHELKKLTIGGGLPVSVSNADLPKGGTWNRNGVMLCALSNVDGLYRIPAEGGDPTPVTTLDSSRGELMHRFPRFLPDGRHFFYLIRSSKPDYSGLYVGSLDSKEKKRISPDPQTAEYVSPGYGLFSRNGKLMAQPFDSTRVDFTGEATPISNDVDSDWVVGPQFSVSENNVLVYGNKCSWKSHPVWFDRSGKQAAAVGEPGKYTFADMSFDEKRLLTNYNGAMWMVDLLKRSFVRFAITENNQATFSPDGSHVAYFEQVESGGNLYQRLSNGTGKAELIFHTNFFVLGQMNWSADGRFIVLSNYDASTRFDLWILPLFGERKAFPYLQTDAREQNGTFSPDGKWIAYESDETGHAEVYVRSFPLEAAGKWQISTTGGQQPKWRRDGKELFYLTLDKKLMATEVQTGQTFEAGTTRLLFQTHAEPILIPNSDINQYFVGADGQHFLINTIIENTTPCELTVMLNWKSLLKKP